MYKYIKRINYPWVEIASEYEDEERLVINLECIAGVYPLMSGRSLNTHCGILLSSGEWLSDLGSAPEKELQELLMSEDPKSL